jgi:hydrogenase maturation protease
MSGVAPLLVFGWGNPSRGDDALGPLFVQRLADRLDPARRAQVEWLEDFQLQVEHALDLVGRERVLLVDASLTAAAPFEAAVVRPAPGRGVSTHALAPAALLQVYADLHGRAAPPTTLLAIRGEAFELGAPLGAAAEAHLVAALDWGEAWVDAITQGRACTS